MRALVCVVTRGELRELADLVQEEDRSAFVVVLEASEVMGRFRKPEAADLLRRLTSRQHGGARTEATLPG